ncbi:MAG: Xylose isomerase protein barrel [Bryobacterales bacterium]|nr:Xylose isomerase protein barrel [Bryobacterales bacterium]
MNRRDILRTIPAFAALSQLEAQSPTGKGRLRPGLVAYSFRAQLEAKKLSYEDLIRMVADLGLEGLDTTVYWFPDTSESYLAGLRRAAHRNGVSLYSVAARVRLCQPTPELQAAEVENAKKWVDVAERLGAGHVRVFGGTVPKGVSEDQAIGWAAEVMKRSCAYAGTKGITLGIEDDGGLSTNAGPTIEIIKRTDSPWAGMNVDTGNFPKDGYAQTAMSVPYAVSTHIKPHVTDADGKRQPADLDRLCALFANGGYRGFVSLEYEEKDPEVGVPKLAPELIRATRKFSGA